jgi:hypothetical protein
MNITGLVDAAVTAVEGVLHQLEIDEDSIADVSATLKKAADGMDPKSFDGRAKMAETVFGDTLSARTLGAHHDMAHTVMAETLAGLITDLNDFCAGVEKAQILFEDADTGAAADLKNLTAGVNAMAYVARHSRADKANDEARNHLPIGTASQGVTP